MKFTNPHTFTSGTNTKYDQYGFNVDGRHQNKTLFNSKGFDVNKIHKHTRRSFDRDGYDIDGYDENGYDINDYDRHGVHMYNDDRDDDYYDRYDRDDDDYYDSDSDDEGR